MTNNEIIRIAIDGPAAAGKSTVAKIIADKLRIVYVDTGAMYRALTYKAIQSNVTITDEKALIDLLKTTTIQLSQSTAGQIVLLDDEDVSFEIRTAAVTNKVSTIAQYPLVRTEMVKRQQQLADNVSVVMDGRDIGTHVLPDAEVKIFLQASVEERAVRRHEENIANGLQSNLQDIMDDIEKRDHQDRTRKTSPLVKASDAQTIDTTSLSIEEVVQKIMSQIKKSNPERQTLDIKE